VNVEHQSVAAAYVPGVDLRALVCDGIPSIVFVVDGATGAIAHVNERFVEYAGRGVEEALGEGWRVIVHPDDLARASRDLRERFTRGEPLRADLRLLDRQGVYRWHDVRASPSRREGGIVERWFGTCTDVDDVRRAERHRSIALSVLTALAGSAEPEQILARFAEAITTELVDFCAVDLDEVGRSRPRRVALALVPSLGPMPKPLASAASREERDALATSPSVSRERLSVARETAFAPLVPRALLVVPLAIDGEVVGHVWLASLGRARVLEARDRADIEELVAQLGAGVKHARAFEQAARASRIRDEFLALVSHELRTPLSTVLGWSRLLREGPSDPARLRRGLEVIERSAATQTRIIDDLLDVSRAVSGKLRLDPQEVSIAAIARDAVEAMRPAAREKRIAMALVLEHEGSFPVDPDRIRQVIDNLLTNATKFTPIGGSISLTVRGVTTGALAPPEDPGGALRPTHVEIEVTDTGVGIDPSFLPYVFDRFRQGDSSTTRRHNGLGIGLAIVRAISELHGGYAEARSDGLGAGATFAIRLPIRAGLASVDRAAARADRPSGQITDLVGVRVLVVDDEADARELSSTILSSHGARVATADSAKEAMRTLEASPVEILLSDIGMPDEDGVSLVRRARAAFPGLAAIALSAYARIEDEERALAAGFARYLTKPVDPENLVRAVASLARPSR
jgi:PAS domain S-box-containing protein